MLFSVVKHPKPIFRTSTSRKKICFFFLSLVSQRSSNGQWQWQCWRQVIKTADFGESNNIIADEIRRLTSMIGIGVHILPGKTTQPGPLEEWLMTWINMRILKLRRWGTPTDLESPLLVKHRAWFLGYLSELSKKLQVDMFNMCLWLWVIVSSLCGYLLFMHSCTFVSSCPLSHSVLSRRGCRALSTCRIFWDMK